jgi:hypothetical protein
VGEASGGLGNPSAGSAFVLLDDRTRIMTLGRTVDAPKTRDQVAARRRPRAAAPRSMCRSALHADPSMMDARDITLTLLAARPAGGTICPSEVARALAISETHARPDAWREAMPAVHATIDRLAAEGLVRLSWKGAALPRRTGPYRIGRG